MKRIVTIALVIFALALGMMVTDTEANGCAYHDRGQCVPGTITNKSWWTPQPQHAMGKAVWYGQNVMEATAEWRGMDLIGFAGGVALMSPADMGEVVWLKRPNHEWEGPFLVTDASARVHMWVTVSHIKEVVEVDWETAKRWGMVEGYAGNVTVNEWMIRDVEVWKGLTPPNKDESVAVNYSQWWVDNVMSFDIGEYPNRIWRMNEIKYRNYAEYQSSLMLAQENEPVAQVIDAHVRNDVYTHDKDLKNSLLATVTPIVVDDYAKSIKVTGNFGIVSGFDYLPHGFNASLIDFSNVINSVSPKTMPDAPQTEETECGVDDGIYENGYEDRGHCVPGMITEESWMVRYPQHTVGAVTYYADGIMEQVVENRGMSLQGYKGGIVLMTCAHMGETVYARPTGGLWEGPYLVVDCSHRYHLWVTLVHNHINAEVDYATWQRWSTDGNVPYVEICIGGKGCEGQAYGFWSYWDDLYKFEPYSD